MPQKPHYCESGSLQNDLWTSLSGQTLLLPIPPDNTAPCRTWWVKSTGKLHEIALCQGCAGHIQPFQVVLSLWQQAMARTEAGAPCHPGNATTFMEPSLPWTSSIHPHSVKSWSNGWRKGVVAIGWWGQSDKCCPVRDSAPYLLFHLFFRWLKTIEIKRCLHDAEASFHLQRGLGQTSTLGLSDSQWIGSCRMESGRQNTTLGLISRKISLLKIHTNLKAGA